MFHLTNTGLREPQRTDRLLLVVAIAVLAGRLQGYALSLEGLRRQVDPHWKRGMSLLRIGLAALQMAVADAAARLMDCLPIPIPPGAGALHPQSQGQKKRGAGLVLNG